MSLRSGKRIRKMLLNNVDGRVKAALFETVTFF